MPMQIGGQSDASFDEPLRLLSDCHRRIERFLDILERVVASKKGGALDDEARRALKTALRYFREAAPRHTADEEFSLFPRMRSKPQGQDPALVQVMERLESDHEEVRVGHHTIERLGSCWLVENRLRSSEVREFYDQVRRLKQAYAAHIQIEDKEIFPAAGRMLNADELAEIGREMAERRGVNRVDAGPA